MSIDRKIYVFDFDCTITKYHTGGCAITKEEISPEYIRNNVKNGFAAVVEHLVREGSGIYIASYGDDSFAGEHKGSVAGHDLIRCYMESILGNDQTYFRFPTRDGDGVIVEYRNVTAKCTQDCKEHHLEIIAKTEDLDTGNPESLKSVVIIDDNEETVRHWHNKGCTILDASSCYKSALLAQSDGLFQRMLKGCV